jgi:hypothetical protein
MAIVLDYGSHRLLLRAKGKAGPKLGAPKVPRRQLFTMFPDKWELALREAKLMITYTNLHGP